MRRLLLHFDGVEMWEITTAPRNAPPPIPAATCYDIIEMMDETLRDAQRFDAPTLALAELHAIVARNAAARLQRIVDRRPRSPRRWSALMTSWLASDPAEGAHHARGKGPAIRVVRAHQTHPTPSKLHA